MIVSILLTLSLTAFLLITVAICPRLQQNKRQYVEKTALVYNKLNSCGLVIILAVGTNTFSGVKFKNLTKFSLTKFLPG